MDTTPATATPQERFGDALKSLRGAAGLTQEELAERAGLSARAISALERGVNRAPRRETLRALLSALPLSDRERAALAAAAQRHAVLRAPEGDGVGERGGVDAPPFVGRATELALIARHLRGVGPPVLLLAGEPGIGKTRLLHAAAERGAANGMRVLEGGCLPQSGQEPYAPLAEALAEALRTCPPAGQRAALAGCEWLARLLPELVAPDLLAAPTSLPPAQERRLMFGAVARCLANLAGPHGSLLLLDDLQWAGGDALDLLVSLPRAPGGTPLRMILAYRASGMAPDAPLHAALAELAHARLATPLTLGPLAPDEAARLLDGLLGAAARGARGAAVLRRAAGVPFFLVSCAQHASEGGSDSGGADGSGDEVPWDVAQSVRQRVMALPVAARALLEAAAVAGRWVTRGLLLALGARLEQRLDETLAALDALHHARLLVAAEADAFVFTHDLVREAVEAELGPGRRIALHRWIAAILEEAAGAEAEPPVARLAFHYQRGAMPERAAVYLEQAGERARARHAHAEAALAYRELAGTLDGLGRSGAARVARLRQGQALVAAARYDEALALLEGLLAASGAAGDHEGMARAAAQLGEAYVLRGTPEEGVRRLETLLALLDMRVVSASGLAAVYVALAWLINATGRYAEALGPAERAAELATAAGDASLRVRAELRRGQLLLMLGRLAEGARVLEAAIPLAEATDDARSLRLALNSLGWVHETWGDFARDGELTERAWAVAERMGDPSVSAFMWSNRGGPAFNLGDWQTARDSFEHGLALMRRQGPSWASAWPPLLLGQLELAQGREGATALLEEAVALAGQSGDLQALRQAQCALAERDLLAGQPAAAQTRLAPLGDRSSQPESDVRTVLPLLAWSYLDLGDAMRALKLAEQAMARAEAAGMRPALVDALRVRALIALRQDDVPAARAALGRALHLSRRLRSPYAGAKVRYTLGLLHARTGADEAACQAWRAARDPLARLGERLYAAEVERALAHVPARVGG